MRVYRFLVFVLTVCCFVVPGSTQVSLAQMRSDNWGEDAEILTRGPVHEAFAETILFNPEPSVIVPQPPPEEIDEVPPDDEPDGSNITWIPGYWAWDDMRGDFVWVSGVWRAMPPGRQWISGYWTRSRSGYQWISGYWADADIDEIEYLPEPPQSLEQGPPMAAPSADLIWAPGCWVWREHGFAWRPGYWHPASTSWVWIPAHYVWTPRGCIFVDDYWDCSVRRRGVFFAPVYFRHRGGPRHLIRYSPHTVIDFDAGREHLFVRPRYHQYYFGDYYDVKYERAGFEPCFAVRRSRVCYEPIFVHERWKNRSDHDWDRRVEARFRERRDHVQSRPPRTWSAMNAMQGRGNVKDKTMLIASTLDQYKNRNPEGLRFRKVDGDKKQQYAQRLKDLVGFRRDREKVEIHENDDRRGSNQGQIKAKVKIPKSNIISKPIHQLEKKRTPPQKLLIPKTDDKIKPRLRNSQDDNKTPFTQKKDANVNNPKVRKTGANDPKASPKDTSKDQSKQTSKKPKDKSKDDPKDPPR